MSEPSNAAYRSLVNGIGSIYRKAEHASRLGLNEAVLESRRTIGRLIVDVEQGGALRAKYGTQLLRQLAEDLNAAFGRGFSERSLHYMRLFHLVYGERKLHFELNWSCYRLLLDVKDGRLRRELEIEAARRLLAKRELEELTRKRAGRPAQPLVWDRPAGEFFTFRLIREVVGFRTAEPVLDLGFAMYHRPSDDTLRSFALQLGVTPDDFPDEVVVRSLKLDGAALAYELLAVDADPRERYVYVAQLIRVVDGDTLLVLVDLGFSVFVRQRLRLRRVDAPELDSERGRKAKSFVEARLVPHGLVVLRTFGTDLYDRYVCDLWYGDAGTSAEMIVREGRLLNAELMDEGLADVVRH